MFDYYSAKESVFVFCTHVQNMVMPAFLSGYSDLALDWETSKYSFLCWRDKNGELALSYNYKEETIMVPINS